MSDVIAGLHPEDRERAAELVKQLRAERRRREIATHALGPRVGRSESWADTVESGNGSWRTGTLQRYAHGLDKRIKFDFDRAPSYVDPVVEMAVHTVRVAAEFERRADAERAELGARLSAIRRLLNLGQDEVARAAGIAKTSVSKIENHAASDPILGYYQAVARAIGHPLRFTLVAHQLVSDQSILTLLDELMNCAKVIEPRYRVTTSYGLIEGLDRAGAITAAKEHGGEVEQQEVALLQTGHVIAGPWQEAA